MKNYSLFRNEFIFKTVRDNMTKAILSFLFFLNSFLIIAQKIQLINEEYGSPVSEVFVYNQDQNRIQISDRLGYIDIAEFQINDTLYFQHPSFKTASYPYLELTNKNVIELKERIIRFDEVVISANKFQEKRSEISQDVISLSGKEIEFSNPQTSADLLSNSGLVFVQKSQYGGGSPTLRGFAANSVLLVVDGIRLNNGIYRSGNLQNVINIDPNSISSTEVVFGPGSVMYGSDALGGVMDFRTESPDFSVDESLSVKGSVFGRFSSAANEKTGHFDINIGKKRIAYFGSFSYSNLDDLEAGSRRSKNYEGFFERDFYAKRINGQDQLVENNNPDIQKFSGYDLYNLIQKISFIVNKNTTATYSFYYSNTTDIPRYDRLTVPVGDTDSLQFSEWYYGPQKWLMHAINIENFSKSKLYDRMQFNASYQKYNESRNDRRFGNVSLRNQNENVDIFTTSIDFEKSIGNSRILYGFDGFYNIIDSEATRTNIETGEASPTGSRYPGGGSTYSSLAAYTSFRTNISDKLRFTSGLRFNQVWLTAETTNEDPQLVLFENLDISNQALTGSFGFIQNLSKKTTINYLFSTGFRSPNIDDIGKVFELDDEILIVPNPDLKPEYVYSGEINFRHNISDIFQIEVVGFYSILNNAIIRGPYQINDQETIVIDGEEKQLRAQINASSANIYGGSIRLKGLINENISYESVLSANEGRTESGEPIRHATPVFGRTRLMYQKEHLTLSLTGNYHFTRKGENMPDAEFIDKDYLYTDIGSPGWFTLTARIGYSFINIIDLEAGVENILDQHYRPYSSGISARGRNFYFTTKFNF